MNTMKNFMSKFAVGIGKKDVPLGAFVNNMFNDKRRLLSVTDHGLDEYNGAIPWVSICANKIVSHIKTRDFYFTDNNGDEIALVSVPDEIKFPFINGYKGITFKNILASFTLNRLLGGNGYIWVVQGTLFGVSNGISDTFIYLPGNRVKLNLSKDGLTILSYVVTLSDGVPFDVLPEDMIHSRDIMTNLFVGVGKVTQLRLSVEGDIAADDYYREFLTESSKMPFSYLISKESKSLVGENLEKEKAKLRLKYSDKIMLIAGDAQVHSGSIMTKDFKFIEQRQYGRQTIISAFGLNTFVLGIPDGSGNERSQNHIIGYQADTLNPLLDDLSQDFNTQFVHRKNKDINFNFRKYAVGDIENVTKSVSYGLMTPAYGAELLGYPVNKDDDVSDSLYIPANLVRIDSIAKTIDQQVENQDSKPKE